VRTNSNALSEKNVSDEIRVEDQVVHSVLMRCPFAAHQSKETRGNANAPPEPSVEIRSIVEEHEAVLLDPTEVQSVLDRIEGSGCAAIARMAIPTIEQTENLEELALIHQEALLVSSVKTKHSPITNDLRREDERTYDSYFGIIRVEGDAAVFVHAVIDAFGRAYRCDGMEDFEGLPWLRTGERELLRLAIPDQALYMEGNDE
jgi:hypothetical protein